jgi:peptidoglycan/LPS O-acetylase OafA/YrhL
MPVSAPASARAAGQHDLGLDLLRAIAAGMVFVYHLTQDGKVAMGILGDHGSTGVTLFFVLSGFLLYRPFLSHGQGTLPYLVRRLARILPAYVAAYVGVSLLTGSQEFWNDPVRHLLFLQPWEPWFVEILGVTWTLHLEVIFYLVLPLVAWNLDRLAWWTKAALLGAFGLYSLAMQWSTGGGADPGRLTVWYLGWAFVPGMLAAVIEQRLPRGRIRAPLLPVGAVLVFAGLFVNLDSRMDWVTGLGAACLVIWLVDGFPRVPQWLAWAITTAAGASYSFYLWHQEIIRALSDNGLEGQGLLVPLAFLATAAIALAIYHVVELPAMGLGRIVASRLRNWHPWVLEGGRETVGAPAPSPREQALPAGAEAGSRPAGGSSGSGRDPSTARLGSASTD